MQSTSSAISAAWSSRPRKAFGAGVVLLSLTLATALLIAPHSAFATGSIRHLATANLGTVEATLHDPGHTAGDDFGYVTSVSGGVAVVGSPQRPDGQGVAYIYVKGSHGWPTTPTVTLHDPAATGGDDFGFAAAVSHKTVVVGALNTDGAQGAAYIYTEGKHGWPTEPTVTLQDPEATDEDGFGQSVAVAGKNLVVGAYQSDSANGAAYVYVEDSDGWPTTPTVTLSHPSDRGEFGNGVAVVDSTIVVGAYMTDEDSGAAYVYAKGPSGWPTSPTTTITDPLATSNDYFPDSVTLSKTTLVLGAEDSNDMNGVAYIYAKGTSGWPTTPTATLSPPATSSRQFGQSVATSGDTVIVTSTDAPVAGYVYDEGSGGWPTTPTGTLAGADVPGFVSMSGSVVVFGEYEYHEVRGLAKIFEL